ncbi:MAG: hypothetical protein ABIQ88_12860 [Chitinophagaceae bacterium]
MKRIITLVIILSIMVIQAYRLRQHNRTVSHEHRIYATDSTCCTDIFLQDTGSGLLIAHHLLY